MFLELSVHLLDVSCLMLALFRTKIGYLHFCMLLWGSLLPSWATESWNRQPLCLKVLMTLNLATRLWLLSHYKYRCVSGGFLYTVVMSVLSGCGITKVSKIETDPSALVSSNVKWICGPMLMCWRNMSFSDDSMTTKVSYTYLCEILELCSTVFYGLSQSPPCRDWPLWSWWVYQYLPWNWKNVVLRQTSSRLMISFTVMGVLWQSSWSCSSFLLMMLMAGSVGTDVKTAGTSLLALYTLDLVYKILGVLNVVGWICLLAPLLLHM